MLGASPAPWFRCLEVASSPGTKSSQAAAGEQPGFTGKETKPHEAAANLGLGSEIFYRRDGRVSEEPPGARTAPSASSKSRKITTTLTKTKYGLRILLNHGSVHGEGANYTETDPRRDSSS